MSHTVAAPSFAMGERLWPRLDTRRLVSGVVTGVITGLFAITLSFSVAALIFSGPLASHVTVGVGLTLFGSVVLGLFISLRSRYRGMVASAQEVPGAILALIAAGIVGAFPAGATAAEMTPTVVAAIALGSLASGALYWLLGRLRLSTLVCLMPHSVVDGFLAATGWVLVAGGIAVCANLPVEGHGPAGWFTASALVHWLPGFGAGLLLFLVSRYCRHYLAFPGALVGVAAVFFLFLLGGGTSLTEATAQGWLLPAPDGDLFHLMTPAAWPQVHWSLLAHQLPGFLALIGLSALSVLLNVSGIAAATHRPVDVDQELRTTGLAHLVSGLGGGAPGYHLLGMSVLGHTLGADSRITGVCAALTTALPLFFGAGIVTLFPTVVLGGLLIFLGLDFLHTWLWQTVRQLPRRESMTVPLMLVVSIAVGALEGTAAGLVAAVIAGLVLQLLTSRMAHARDHLWIAVSAA